MTYRSKTLLVHLVAGLCFTMPFAGLAGPYDDGVKADNLGDYEAAAVFYTAAAAQGHMGAQLRLGVLYINGQGVAQSDEQAAAAFQQAADQGLSEAQYYLGVLYQKGRGVPKSKQRAAELFRLAADQDQPEAQFALAMLYFYGQGIPQSKEVAMIWLKKAAALGDLTARAQLKQLGIQ